MRQTGEKKSKKAARIGVLRDYNMNMGFVDNFDAALNLYQYRGRNKSWKRCMFYALLKMLVVVSQKLFLSFNPHLKGRNKQQLKHLTALIQELAQEKSEPSRILNCHYPHQTSVAKCCTYCKSRKIRSNTVFKCLGCGVYLHPKCWVKHHK